LVADVKLREESCQAEVVEEEHWDTTLEVELEVELEEVEEVQGTGFDLAQPSKQPVPLDAELAVADLRLLPRAQSPFHLHAVRLVRGGDELVGGAFEQPFAFGRPCWVLLMIVRYLAQISPVKSEVVVVGGGWL
jgi:hypothetical protein